MSENKKDIIIANVSENRTVKQPVITAKKIKHGSLSAGVVALFIAVAVIINIGVGIAASKLYLKVDLTEDQTYSLCDETLAFLKEMPGTAEIIILGVEEEYRSAVSTSTEISYRQFIVETVDNYVRESEGKITEYYVDPTYNPYFFSSRNIVIDTTGEDNVVVIVYCPETQRNRQIYDSIFDDLQYVGLERRITGGLVYSTKTDIQNVGVLIGHGEFEVNADGISNLKDLLQENGFNIFSVTFDQLESYSDKINILIMVNPMMTYSDNDISILDAFLANDGKLGKHLMVFSDLDAADNPKLDDYLREWGLEFGKESVFDEKNSYAFSNQYEPFLKLTYEPDTLFTELLNGNYSVDVQLGKTRAVNILFSSEDSVSTQTLINTYDTAFGREMFNTNISADDFKNIKKSEGDSSGPFSIMTLSSKARYDGTDRISSNILLCGSTSFMKAYYLSNIDGSKQTVSQCLIETVKYLVDATESVDTSILPKNLLPYTLNFENTTQVRWIFIGIPFGIPVIFAIICIVVYKKRNSL